MDNPINEAIETLSAFVDGVATFEDVVDLLNKLTAYQEQEEANELE